MSSTTTSAESVSLTYVDIMTGEPFVVDDDVDAAFDQIVAEHEWFDCVRLLPPDERVSLLCAAPVGMELMNQLRLIDPSMVDDEARLLLAQLWERCVGWVTDQAAQAAAVFIEAVTDPPEERAYHRRGVPVVAGVCLREIGVATGLSEAKAAMRILCGRALGPAGVLAETGKALRAGRISPDVAYAFVDATLSLTPDQARAVQDLVLPRAIAVIDPDTGQGCWRTRTWAVAALRRAVITVDPDAVTRRRHHATNRRHVDLTFEHDTGMAYLTAYLPAAEAVEIRHALDALAAALRHHDIARNNSGDDTTIGEFGRPRPWGAARTDALVTAIRAAVTALEATGGLPDSHGKPRIEVGVLIDLPTLTHLANHPGEILGYGPIDPDYARLLAANAGTWRRWTLDPVTGHLLDLGRTRYAPTQQLRDYLLAAYPHCTRPECHRPSIDTDLDHARPWHQGGTTAATNLHPLCRTDHVDKTTGWTQTTINPDHTITHTTRHGLTRTYEPAWKPHTDTLTHGQAPPSTHADPDEGTPPF